MEFRSSAASLLRDDWISASALLVASLTARRDRASAIRLSRRAPPACVRNLRRELCCCCMHGGILPLHGCLVDTFCAALFIAPFTDQPLCSEGLRVRGIRFSERRSSLFKYCKELCRKFLGGKEMGSRHQALFFSGSLGACFRGAIENRKPGWRIVVP